MMIGFTGLSGRYLDFESSVSPNALAGLYGQTKCQDKKHPQSCEYQLGFFWGWTCFFQILAGLSQKWK
jgi:hypothetical protein